MKQIDRKYYKLRKLYLQNSSKTFSGYYSALHILKMYLKIFT